MSGNGPVKSAERRLNSWKEIAAFVGRDERTVKRWERTRGLPVRRLPGPGHIYVFAYIDEVDAWLNGRDATPALSPVAVGTPAQPRVLSKRGLQGLAGGMAALVLAAIVILAVRGDAPIGGFAGSTVIASKDIPSARAVQLYRAGLHEWQSRSPSSLTSAVADFNQALRVDPHYATAYVGLADAYNLEGEFTSIPADRLYWKATVAAKRAIALEPSLAGAHAALAFSDFYGSRDVSGARQEFERALTLDPGSAIAHHWYATFLMTVGDYREALNEIDRAANLDSESSAIPADKALILFHAGKKELAVRLLTQLEQDQPEFAAPHRYLATIWFATANDAAYLRELKLSAIARHDDTDIALATAGASGLARGGHLGMLRAILAAQQALYAKGRQSAFRLAATLALLHDTKDALSFLAVSVRRHEADNIALKVDPPFDSLRKDPRFADLLARASLNTGL